MNRQLAMPLLFALFLAALSLSACESEGSSDGPPMQAVPVSEGAANTMGPATGSEAAGALPADHPPIPGAQGGLEGGNLPPGHPPLPNDQAMAAPGGAGGPGFLNAPRMDAGGLNWEAPASWVAQPPASSMRLAQWQVGASQAAGPAECALLRFQGAGGGVQENLIRWVGQFTQPDGSASADHAEQFQASVNGLRVTRLEVTGTFTAASMGPMMGGGSTELPDYMLVAAVVETPQGMYFVKCTGPEATVTAERPSMLAFLETLSL